ncbi:MAG TPA: ABC transporter permease [Streptosporangiaceae bacterium]|jgi:peptide/nickel transport system permease protein
MWRYLIRRMLWLVVTLLVITALTFVIYFVLPPVSPAVLFAGKEATPQLVATVQQNLGLDHPVWVQYLLFVRRLVTGDRYGWPGLGFSYVNHSSVLALISGRVVITVTLAAGAAVIWLAIGIPVGVISAVTRGSVWDRLSLGFALFFVSAPVFWLALVFLWLFWYKLGIADGTGYYSPGRYGVLSWLGHMIMPWTALALLYAGWYARMTRGSVLDTLHQDFIRTARGKGLPEFRVLTRHVLRASLTPTLTMFGMDLAALVSGTVIIETVFNLNGVGQWAVQSVLADDIPSVLAVTLLAAVAVMLANLIVDVLYAYVDPRIRYD